MDLMMDKEVGDFTFCGEWRYQYTYILETFLNKSKFMMEPIQEDGAGTLD